MSTIWISTSNRNKKKLNLFGQNSSLKLHRLGIVCFFSAEKKPFRIPGQGRGPVRPPPPSPHRRWHPGSHRHRSSCFGLCALKTRKGGIRSLLNNHHHSPIHNHHSLRRPLPNCLPPPLSPPPGPPHRILARPGLWVTVGLYIPGRLPANTQAVSCE